MPPETEIDPGAQEQLTEAMLSYLRGMEAGAPDRQRILDDYPQVAAELMAFFADQDQVDIGLAAVRSLAPPSDARLDSFGDYQIGDKIGWGGSGVVYQAWQISLKRPIAVKVLRDRQRLEPDVVQRILREAQDQANLDHPHIVPIYEVGTHHGLPYFSMKLMEGGSLALRLDDFQLPGDHPGASGQNPSKPAIKSRQATIAQLLATVAEAVHHAHQRGLLHRDLKPGNILLDGQDQPHVTDFGLAVRVAGAGAADQPAGIAGTSSYMAPEQAAGSKGLTTAVDVYGLGAVLYELLTGRVPFRGADWNATLDQVQNQPPVPPRRLEARASRDLEAICLKCLQKDPAQRYAGAGELARDLRRYQAGEPVRARPSTVWERGLKWARRKPAVACLVAAVILVAVAGAGAVVWQWGKTTAALGDAENQLYVNLIGRAPNFLAQADFARAEEILDLCPPHLRHWEWDYLKHWCQPDVVTLVGHQGHVSHVAYSPAGDMLATAAADGSVRLYQADTGKELAKLHDKSFWVESFTFSPDGMRLALAEENRKVRVWNLNTRKKVCDFSGGNRVAFHPDGKLLACAGPGKTLQIWDTEINLPLFHWENDGNVMCLTFSPDGKWLVVGGFGEDPLTIWDWKTGTKAPELSKALDFGNNDWVLAVAFYPGEKGVVVTRSTTKILDLQSGAVHPGLRGYTRECKSISVSGDGHHVAAIFGDGVVGIWDTKDGQPLFRAATDGAKPTSVALSPSGDRLAIARGKVVTLERWQDRRDPICVRLDGSLATFLATAFSPDGLHLACASEEHISIHDIAKRQIIRVLQGHKKSVLGVAYSPDGKLLASASSDGTVRMWDPRTEKELHCLPGHEGRVTGLAFSPNGKQLASVSQDKTLKLWDVDSGTMMLSKSAHRKYINGVAFSPDGRRLATWSRDWMVKVWELETLNEPVTLAGGHRNEICSAAFSDDGRWLASADTNGMIRIWDAAIGKINRTLYRHTGAVTGLAFSPDGRRLFSAGQDGTLRIWDYANEQELLSLPSPRGIASLAICQEGHQLATTHVDGSVKIWDHRLLQQNR